MDIATAAMIAWTAIVVLPGGVALGDVNQDVDRIHSFWNDPDAGFGQIAPLTEKLAKQYTDPTDQAAIYFAAAQTYQSRGMSEPDECLAVVHKALSLPQSPANVMQLHGIWGDVIVTQHENARGKKLIQPRRDAAEQYLLAVKVAVDEKLPEQAPPRPGIPFGPLEVHFPANEDPAKVAAYNQYVKDTQADIAKALAEWKQVKEEEELIRKRDAAIERVVELYTKFPFSSKECENLCSQTLHDEPTVSRIMKKVNENIQKQVGSATDGGRMDVRDGFVDPTDLVQVQSNNR